MIKEKAMVGIVTAAMAMSMMACGSTGSSQADTESNVEASVAESTTEIAEETAGADSTESAAAETTDAEMDNAAEGDSTDSVAASDQITILSYLGDTDSDYVSGDKVTEILTESNENTKMKVSVTEQKLQEAESGEKLTYAAGCDTLVQFIKVEDSAKEALQKALDQDNETQMELQRESYADILSFDQEMSSMNESDDSDEAATEDAGDSSMRYSLESTVIVKRADDKILSYVRQNYSYTGSAHPSTMYTGNNYDPKTGKVLKLQDVVNDYDGLYQAVMDALVKVNESQDNSVFFDEYKDTVKSMFYGADSDGSASSEDYGLTDSLNWVMTDDGVYIIFNQYDIAPYATGQFIAEIPFGTGFVNENYQ